MTKVSDMTLDQLRELTIFMRDNGIASFECGPVKVSFDPRAFDVVKPELPPEVMKQVKLEQIQQAIDVAKKQKEQEDRDLFYSVD